MKLDRRKKIILAAAIAPGLTFFGMIRFFKVEAWWLFTYFGLLFTVVSFMLASTFVEWTEKPEPVQRHYSLSRPRPKR